jgi:hypothetical protein
MLDLRLPIGLLFSLVGALLLVFGLVTSSNGPMYQHSLGININIWWGLFLTAFGVVMLVLARKGTNRGE